MAAKRATSTVPIVFVSGVDPVTAGLVSSIPRPGGNLTGINFFTAEIVPKRIDFLSGIVPNAQSLGLLANPKNSNFDYLIGIARGAARSRDLGLQVYKASSDEDIEAAFAAKDRVDGLVIGPDSFLNSRPTQIAALALEHGIPASGESREFVAAGGLMSYGTNYTVVFRQVGTYVGRILNGEKPADLPVQQPTKFDLILNLNTGKRLGLTLSPALLARADEVIE